MSLSPKTLLMDRGTLENRFLPFMIKECGGRDIQIQNIKPLHLDRFFAMRAKTVKELAIRADQSAISGLFNWCIVNGLMRGPSPLAGRKWAKPKQKAKLYVPLQDFPHLLNAARCPRDRAIIATGVYLFTRSGSETALLKIKDLDLARSELGVFQPKTGKFDLMPISREYDNELRRWLTWYAEEMRQPLDPDWYLIPARKKSSVFREEGGRLRATSELNPTRPVGTPYRFVQYALEELGYPTERQGGHTLRRSGARALFDELVAKGYDGALEIIREMLHHSSVEMTEKYLGVTVGQYRRDALIKGQIMFPSLLEAEGNVIPLLKRG